MDEREDEHSRIRHYLASQSAKLSMPEIASRIEAAFGELWLSLDGLNSTQLAFKPEPEAWSIGEDIAHLTEANTHACKTIKALVLGQEVPEGDASAMDACAGNDVLERAAEGRDQVLQLLRELPEPASLEATAPYPNFGELNCKEWLLFLRLHTLDHAQQARAVRVHPDFPA